MLDCPMVCAHNVGSEPCVAQCDHIRCSHALTGAHHSRKNVVQINLY